jgi:hypothetical protein
MMFKTITTIAFCATTVLGQIMGGDFPTELNGPKSKHSKIAIIGGGPSGLHMAHLLKQQGYERVRIFEADDEIGGKTRAFGQVDADEGVAIDSGALYMLDDVVYKRTHALLAETELDGENLVSPDAPLVEDAPVSAAIGAPAGTALSIASWAGARAFGLFAPEEQQEFGLQYGAFCVSLAPLGCDPTAPPSPANAFYTQFVSLYVGATAEAYKATINGILGPDPRVQEYGFASYNPATAPILSLTVDQFLDQPLNPLVAAGVAAQTALQTGGFELQLSNLKFMRPLFDLYLSTQGYGTRATTPMYYGAYWVSSNFIDLVLRRISGVPIPVEKDFALLQSGVAAVFEELIELSDLDVRVGSEVKSIRKLRGGSARFLKDRFMIRYRQTQNRRGRKLRWARNRRYVADFVISAIPVHRFTPLLVNVDSTAIDAAVSCSVNSRWRVTEALVSQPAIPSSTLYSMEQINMSPLSGNVVQGPVAVMAQADVKAGSDASDYIGATERVNVLYEFNHNDDDELDFTRLGIQTMEVVNQRVHEDYFPHPENFTQCSPWQVLSEQGVNDIWYIGGSVSFETIEGVLNYNHMLLDQFLGQA